MPSATLRPNSTIANTGPWTITGAATAHEAVDDVVTQPTAATTTDLVTTSTAGRVLDLGLSDSATDTITVSDVTIWMYASTAGNDRITVGLFHSGSTQVGVDQFDANLTSTYTWYSATLSGLSLTKTQIDGAFLRLSSKATGGMSAVNCAAIYVDITYTNVTTSSRSAVMTAAISVSGGGSQTYAQMIAARSDTVAHWRLGDLNDSVGTHTLTNNGATTGVTGIPGGGDTAVSVASNTDLTTPDAADLNPGSNPFTIIVWAKPAGTPSAHNTIVGKAVTDTTVTANRQFRLLQSSTDIWRASTYGGSTSYNVEGTGVTTDKTAYTMLAAVKSGTTLTLYANGTQIGSGAAPTTVNTTTGPFWIGSFANIEPFAGSIDEVSFHNAAISQTDLAALYTAGTTAGGVQTLSRSAVMTAAISTPGTYTPQVANWRWYTDAADGSMTALAAENTAPVLSGSAMQNGMVRLRLQISETGGSAGTSQVYLDYSADGGASWEWVETTPLTTSTQNGTWFRYGNGAATAGATIASTRLTGSTASGTYVEAPGQTLSIAASAVKEYDFAVYVHWPPPDTDILFRVRVGTSMDPATGTVMSGNTPSLTTSTAANRPWAVARLDPGDINKVSQEPKHAVNQRIFYGAGRWWMAIFQTSSGTILRVYSWTGSGAWTLASSPTLSANGRYGINGITWATINGVSVIHATYGNTTTTYGIRGVLNTDGTITWGSEWNVSQPHVGFRAAGVDDGGYLWIAGTNSTNDYVWVRRSTNADTGSGWTSGFNAAITIADTDLSSSTGASTGNPIGIVPLGSNDVLVAWNSGSMLYWSRVTGTATARAAINATATAHPEDWGITRLGGFVYVVHKEGAANSAWVLRIFDTSNSTWSTGTSPGVSGQTSGSDGLPMSASPATGHVFVAGTMTGSEGGSDRVWSLYRYTVSGGTWSSAVLTTPGNRGNGDHSFMPRVAGDDGRTVVGVNFNDDEILGHPRTLEYHPYQIYTVNTRSAVMTAAISAGSTEVQRSAPMTAAIRVTSERSAALTAAVRLTFERSVSLTAAIRTTLERSTVTTGAIRTTLERSAAANAAVRTTLERAALLTAAVRTTLERSASQSAAIRTTNERQSPLTAALGTTTTLSAPTTAAVRVEHVRNAPLTSAIRTTSSRSATLTGAISVLGTSQRSAPLTASIRTTNARSAAATVAVKTTSEHASVAEASIMTVNSRASLLTAAVSVASARQAAMVAAISTAPLPTDGFGIDPFGTSPFGGGPSLPGITIPWPTSVVAQVADAPAALMELTPMAVAEGIDISLPSVILVESEDIEAMAYDVQEPSADAFDIPDAPASLVYLYPSEA